MVYFDTDGSRFGTSDIRVPVWQKLPIGGRPICCCFGESEASIRMEIEATGRSLAVDRIREHIAAGRCACEIRNPRGACCLGDVTAAVKRGQGAMQTRVMEDANEIGGDADAAQNTFSIGELASRTGLTPDALRYHERVGVLAPAPRTSGGFRVYTTDVIESSIHQASADARTNARGNSRAASA